MHQPISILKVSCICVVLCFLVNPNSYADQRTWQREEVNLRLGSGNQIVAIKRPPAAAQLSSMSAMTASESIPAHPQPPLAGFSPLIAVTTSDKKDSDDLNFVHQLEYIYDGTPLNPPASENFVIGYLDTGAEITLVAEPYDIPLGLTGDILGTNYLPLGGVGDPVNAIITRPMAVFVAGFDAIQANGDLDLTRVVGHSNVSIAVAPEISCGGGEAVTAAVGAPLLGFFTTVIRNDLPRTVTVNNQTYTSPDVQIYDPFDPDIPTYTHSISVTAEGLLPPSTASFYALLEGLETGDPIFPTLLAALPGSIPTGGLFYTNIGVVEGEPSPTNPLQTAHVVLDTGAQSSILSPAIAANLSLPTTADFYVDVCGVGGTQVDVPGYYIDYVKINAYGGALEFSNAPFVILDLGSPDIHGILGMNFFWNRNIIFEPDLASFSFLHVSDPIGYAYGDFDRDFDVDQDDFIFFENCASGPAIPFTDPSCTEVDSDGDSDIDQTDFGKFQACYSGPGNTPDPSCGS